MQAVAVDFHLLEQLCVVEEVGGVATLEFVGDGAFDDGGVLLGFEQRVTPAGTGVLDRGTVAAGDGSVFEFDIDDDRLAGLANLVEAVGDRLTLVGEAVVFCSLLDRALVVEEEPGVAGRCVYACNIHSFTSPWGRPMSLPSLIASTSSATIRNDCLRPSVSARWDSRAL